MEQPDTDMNDETRLDLLNAISAWDRAMIANDPDAIGEFMTEDWLIVGPDGNVTGKGAFLAQVRSGDLTHDTMTSEDPSVRLYGDCGVVLSHGISGGRYQGRAFREHERASSVFVRRDGRWRCVLTHLSKLEASA